MTQRNWTAEWKALLKEYEVAKEEYWHLSGVVISAMAAVARGQVQANPPFELIVAADAAHDSWKTAGTKLDAFVAEWAKTPN